MIALGTSQQLYAVATSATTVTYTIYGLLMNSTSPPVASGYQVLGQGQVAASAGSIYNPGASNTALVSSIFLMNTGASAQTVTLYQGGTAAANELFSGVIPAGGTATYESGNGWSIYNSSGQLQTSNITPLAPGGFNGTQVGTLGQTMPASVVGTATEAALTSGTMVLYPCYIPAGQVIGHITFISGTTAFSTPTNWWYCLTDNNRNLLALTANQLTATWGASTLKQLAIASTAAGAATTYTTQYSGLFYIGIMGAGTTVPTLQGFTPGATTLLTTAAAGIIGGKSSTTGLTSLSTFPTQYGAITNSAFWVYGEVGT